MSPGDYFKLQKTVLKIMGISLEPSDGFFYKIYSFFCLITVVGFYTAIESLGFYVYFDDMDVLASIVSLGVTHILGAIKVFILLRNKSKIQEILGNLHGGIFEPKNSTEERMIAECKEVTIKQSLTYYACATTVWFFVMIRTIKSRLQNDDYRKWQTPAVPFVLFDLKKSPDFEIVALFQAFCITAFAYIISSTDLLITSVVAHLKTQLSILRNSISVIIKEAANLASMDGFSVDFREPSTVPNRFLDECLRKIVIFHEAVIQLGKEFEKRFNFLILTVFIGNVTILCFTMYHASLSYVFYSPCVMVWNFIVIRTVSSRIKYPDDYKQWQPPALPFSLFTPKKSPDFELISIFQITGLTVAAFIISSMDMIVVGVLIHLKTQLKMLRNSILRMTKDAANLAKKNGLEVDCNDPSTVPDGFLLYFSRKIVIYHQTIIDQANEFEQRFNFLLLSMMLGNMTILCFTMYHASLYPITNEHSIQDFIFIMTISTQVFLYCYWGNELTLESQKVAESCYETNFVGTSTSFHRSLMIIMHRSQRPIVITAGKFTNLSLITFVSIMRVSYSYYMVLRTTNDV